MAKQLSAKRPELQIDIDEAAIPRDPIWICRARTLRGHKFFNTIYRGPCYENRCELLDDTGMYGKVPEKTPGLTLSVFPKKNHWRFAGSWANSWHGEKC